ncbi:hypothetical protein PoB_003099700 [Plakobranchus ocellatus]|uniref:Uncharacterized protein n=1 Tax=Plakobranchus ocellatus TaxID=259542 RepID=A0AAV4AB78_9GAST|nr:hypothetical protein PoB_003099700 [Plakobranchus ocellatus]
MSDHASRSRCAAISANAIAKDRLPSRLNFKRRQQRPPRMAAEVPLLPRPRGKSPEDSPAPSPLGSAETEVPAKRRAEKSKRQESPRETLNLNRFAPLAMEAEETISSVWGIPPTSAPRGP